MLKVYIFILFRRLETHITMKKYAAIDTHTSITNVTEMERKVNIHKNCLNYSCELHSY